MKSIYSLFISSAIALFAVQNFAVAQTVGTIGIGDIKYEVRNQQSARSSDSIISAINNNLNSALINTRKFEVLNYSQLTQRLSKQNLRLQGYYDKTYQGTEYSQAGLDYILTATVTELGSYRQNSDQSDNAVGSVAIDFKLIGVADVTEDFESNVSVQSIVPISAGDNQAVDGVLDQTILKGVELLVDKVIVNLFPIRVMKISEEGEITLNYGKGLLKVGDTILVFNKDEDIALDKNGNAAGESVAKLQVSSTQQKFANAQALSGFDNLELGQKGHLVLSDR